jgi:ATP-dependent helicase YprA (DUF1998 family)
VLWAEINICPHIFVCVILPNPDFFVRPQSETNLDCVVFWMVDWVDRWHTVTAISVLTLSCPARHICPTYKESFQVCWDNSIPLFLHAAICLEVSLFRWTSQNAFSRETAMYKWYCVQCCIAALHTVSFVHVYFIGEEFCVWLLR